MGRRRRRLPRFLLNAATAVSLVLCVATVTLWARSYRRCDYVLFGDRLEPTILRSERGGIYVHPDYKHAELGLGSEPATARPIEAEFAAAVQRWRPLRIWRRQLSDRPPPDGEHLVVVVVPHWVPTFALLVAPLWSARRGRRYPRGLCPACGYDLRATPERCPECGAAPAAPSV